MALACAGGTEQPVDTVGGESGGANPDSQGSELKKW